MKLFLITKLVRFIDNKRIEAFHHDQFHGYGWRGKDMRETRGYRHFHGTLPLSMILNVFRINHCIQPNLTLVISEKAKDALGDLEGVVFAPVIIERAFVREYHEGDFSYWDNGYEYEDSFSYFKKQINDPKAAKQCPRYYEVVPPRYDDLPEHLKNGEKLFASEGPSEFSGFIEITAGQEFIQKYGWFQHEAKNIIREDIFEKLLPYINQDYYWITDLK